MSKTIFLIAGEPSGDALGAGLMHSLKAQSPGIRFVGIGGPKMETAGFKSLLPMSELSVMGLTEIIAHLPRLWKIGMGIIEEIEKRKPDAVITIDLPDFNFQILSRLKTRGQCKAKLIHYVAPSVWAWRSKRADKIAGFLDGLMCLFPFEPVLFPKVKKTAFVGHPLVEMHTEPGKGAQFRAQYEIPAEAKTLGLFFGSRSAEFKNSGQTLKDTAAFIKETYPDLHLIVPTLPQLEYDIMKLIQGLDCPTYVVTNQDVKWDAFAACDAAVAVSGTVGLELAYAGVPHIITYKMSPLTWLVVKQMVKVKYAHLANILLNEEAVPEFLQGKSDAMLIGRGLLKYYTLESERKAQAEKMARLRELLGANDPRPPSTRAAEFVLSVMDV